jgi:hypothetical protein
MVTQSRSPYRSVIKPNEARPTVMPAQKPVALKPEAKGLASRSRSMKVTIHPPKATAYVSFIIAICEIALPSAPT